MSWSGQNWNSQQQQPREWKKFLVRQLATGRSELRERDAFFPKGADVELMRLDAVVGSGSFGFSCRAFPGSAQGAGRVGRMGPWHRCKRCPRHPSLGQSAGCGQANIRLETRPDIIFVLLPMQFRTPGAIKPFRQVRVHSRRAILGLLGFLCVSNPVTKGFKRRPHFFCAGGTSPG